MTRVGRVRYPDAMSSVSVTRIVSGGQTGVDRGGLDAAIELGIEHGGHCPRGRLAEDGVIPGRYHLTELESRAYVARTERNVMDSDGTLIISRGRLTGGSALTRQLARAHGKPCLHIEFARMPDERERVQRIRAWLAHHGIRVLNVAGPRASHCPGIADEARSLMIAVLRS